MAQWLQPSRREGSCGRKTVWKQLWGARVPTSSLWESKQHPLLWGWGGQRGSVRLTASLEGESPSRGGAEGGQQLRMETDGGWTLDTAWQTSNEELWQVHSS